MKRSQLREIILEVMKGDAANGHRILDTANKKNVAAILKGGLPKYGKDKTATKMKESALSPGYSTNVYSKNEMIEATIYQDGKVSLTLRLPNFKESMGSIQLSQLTDKYLLDYMVETGIPLERAKSEIQGFVEKVQSKRR